MPLSARARIELYFPVVPNSPFQDLHVEFAEEFCHTWGGCSLIENVVGYYLSRKGAIIKDEINLLYTDTDLDFAEHLGMLTRYAERLRTVVMNSLEEEAILIAVVAVWHAT